MEKVFLHPYYILIIRLLAGGPLLILPWLSVLPRILLLMNYPRHFTPMILWLCFIAKECHTPTSSLLAGAILQIGTAIIRFATCVPREVH